MYIRKYESFFESYEKEFLDLDIHEYENLLLSGYVDFDILKFFEKHKNLCKSSYLLIRACHYSLNHKERIQSLIEGYIKGVNTFTSIDPQKSQEILETLAYHIQSFLNKKLEGDNLHNSGIYQTEIE